MSKQSNFLRASAALFTAVLLLSPQAARALNIAPGQPIDSRLEQADQTNGELRYQIRCWQHGRLMFEQNNVCSPARTAGMVLKPVAIDGNGATLYVFDAFHAACLMQGQLRDSGHPAAGLQGQR